MITDRVVPCSPVVVNTFLILNPSKSKSSKNKEEKMYIKNGKIKTKKFLFEK